jgi:TRAP-type C4-dicarboxylate transport system substrate-binding protein
MKRAKFYAAMLFAGLVAASPAGAADIKERTIKVGIGLSADHPQGQAVAKFGELVSQKSESKIKVKLFAGGLLGNDVSMTSSLQGGTQEMTIPDTSTLVGIAGLKEFGLINLPFVFNSSQEADALLDGPWGQKPEADGEAAGKGTGRTRLLGKRLPPDQQQPAPDQQG